MMTKQDMVDIAYQQVALQGGPATHPIKTGCFYRVGTDSTYPTTTFTGRCCLVGALIPDALYDPSMEGGSIHTLLSENPDVIPEADDDSTLEQFLNKLQYIHDSTSARLVLQARDAWNQQPETDEFIELTIEEQRATQVKFHEDYITEHFWPLFNDKFSQFVESEGLEFPSTNTARSGE